MEKNNLWEILDLKRIAEKTDFQDLRGMIYVILGSLYAGSTNNLFKIMIDFAQSESDRLNNL